MLDVCKFLLAELLGCFYFILKLFYLFVFFGGLPLVSIFSKLNVVMHLILLRLKFGHSDFKFDYLGLVVGAGFS